MDEGQLLLAVAADGTAANKVATTTLETAGLLERRHLQEWVVAHPEILGLGVKVVTVEYAGWEIFGGGAQHDRLDILGLDSDGRLVVAELKRGIAPDTVEMQAIKYAAMASKFSLDTLAAAYVSYTSKPGAEITPAQATEALLAHAAAISDESLAEPRVVLIAQDFSPIVVSSVVWLAQRGVDISLVRFQPYQSDDGRIFVTFSGLYPLPELSIISPTAGGVEVSSEKLPQIEWSATDLISLGRLANLTTRTALVLCAEKPGQFVSLTAVVDAAGVSRASAKAQLAGLTMLVKRRFLRRNWPFVTQWSVDGSLQAFYTMSEPVSERWREAAIQLEIEQSDPVDNGGAEETSEEGASASASLDLL